MSDIDFDELDREVNKLVNSASVTEDTAQPIATDNSTATPETDVNETNNDTVETSSNEVKNVSTDDPVVTRPRGRFMDVVHPSSDMSSSSGGDSSSLTSTPDRKTLTPLTLDKDTEGSSEISQVAMPNDGDEAQQNSTNDHIGLNGGADSGSNDEDRNSTDMPDPIAVHEARQAEEKSSEEATDDNVSIDDATGEDSPAEGTILAAAIPGVVNETEEVPTPFVPDSKVEKRPLGQYNDEEKEKKVAEDLSEAIDTKIDEAITEASGAKDEAATPEPEVFVPLPPELEKDLVAIEAGESPDEILSGPSEGDEKNTDESEDEQKTPQEVDPEGSRNAAEKENSAAALLASGSIPQQYKLALQKKAGAEGDTTTPQLFNAEHYATSPSKQGSRHHSKIAVVFQWMLIVVGVLLLGASIGAGLYVFVSNQ